MASKIYSVSYLATADDSGHCLSFWTREEAEAARRWLMADGCYHVSAAWAGTRQERWITVCKAS